MLAPWVSLIRNRLKTPLIRPRRSTDRLARDFQNVPVPDRSEIFASWIPDGLICPIILKKFWPFLNKNKALFHNVDHHYSVISELCTADSCPTMTGPGSAVFLWVDERGKKIKCSAPQYIGQFEANGHTWANREPLRHMMFSWLIIKWLKKWEFV